MRIGISMKSFDPSWGGPGTYTVELVNQLVRRDTDNQYVLFYPADITARIRPGAPGHVREITVGGPRGLWWDQVSLPRACSRERIDVLFSPFMAIPVMGGFRKVFTIHGAERYVVPDMLPAIQQQKWRFMEMAMVPRADRLLVVSETMGRDFSRATGCPAEKIRSIYLGVSSEFHAIESQEELQRTRAAHSLPPDFLLFVGRIFPNKNFGNLLRGYAGIAAGIPHKLVVVGGTRWKFENEFRMLRELGIEERVVFLDFVSQEDLVHLYNLATCLVYPSYYESFGLVQVEAMACGCPVVAADTGALPEVAGDAATFCNPNDPADIGKAILRLVNDPAYRAAQREKGLKRAATYTWDRCAVQTLAVLREVVESIR